MAATHPARRGTFDCMSLKTGLAGKSAFEPAAPFFPTAGSFNADQAGVAGVRPADRRRVAIPCAQAVRPRCQAELVLVGAFGAYRKGLQVIRRDDSGRDLVDFHSFRRSAIKCLENARVPQSEAAQVVGHERAGITFGTYNPEGMNLKALRDVVENIRSYGDTGVTSRAHNSERCQWRQPSRGNPIRPQTPGNTGGAPCPNSRSTIPTKNAAKPLARDSASTTTPTARPSTRGTQSAIGRGGRP